MFDKDFVTVGTVGIIRDAGNRTDSCVKAGTNTAGKFTDYLFTRGEEEEAAVAGNRTDSCVKAGTNTAGKEKKVDRPVRPGSYHEMFQKMLKDRNALAVENDKLKEENRHLLELIRDLYGTLSTDCEYTAGILERYDPGNADMISFLHMERINAEEARLEIMAEVGVPETFPEETDGLENFGEEEDPDADVPFR